MSRSTDPRHFFQTDAEIQSASRKAAKAVNNTAGNPIKLSSKILAVHLDPTDDAGLTIFVAESAGTARRIRLPPRDQLLPGKSGDVDVAWDGTSLHADETSPQKTRHIYRGATAPLTSLALSPDSRTIYSGCWDKSIWSWSVPSRTLHRRYTGHTDFVKSVLCAAGPPNPYAPGPPHHRDILISGSADSTIIIWDAASGVKLAIVRDTGRILSLAFHPLRFAFASPPPPQSHASAAKPPCAFTLLSASADPEIRSWRVEIDVDAASPSPASSRVRVRVREGAKMPALTHETSVNGMCVTPRLAGFPLRVEDVPEVEVEEEEDAGVKLWTASSDFSARAFVASGDGGGEDGEGWKQRLKMEHPDFVRAVVVDVAGGLVVTACRDEEVRVFDAETGEMVHVWRGHFEEVTGLALLGAEGGRHGEVVSVSIDGTIRRWSLERGEMDRARVREMDEGQVVGVKVVEEKKESMLTAEEERELEELMENDED